MPKRHAAAERESQPKAAEKDGSLPLWVKLLVSGVIAFHLAAVFLAPMAFATEDSSPLVNRLYSLVRPYATALYLNHRYFFFAPETGPAHLVDYKVEFADGRPAKTGRFPDLKTERPRLLYHRHFMLAEALNNRFVPPEPPPEPSPPPLTATPAEKTVYQAMRTEYTRQIAEWTHARRQYDAMRKSFEEHLLDKYGGSRVTLTRVEHRLLSPEEVQLAGTRLNDPSTYVNLPETNPNSAGGRR